MGLFFIKPLTQQGLNYLYCYFWNSNYCKMILWALCYHMKQKQFLLCQADFTSTCSRIMCLQHAQDLFKQGWDGPDCTQAITLAGLPANRPLHPASCCQETAPIFLLLFLVSVSGLCLLAHCQFPFSVASCSFIWQKLIWVP